VARDHEYLEEALEEAEAAARWYAERSPAAAVGFTDEINGAEDGILQLPEAWPQFDHGTRRYLLRRFPSASSTELSRLVFSFSPLHTGIGGLGTGSHDCLADSALEPSRPTVRCYPVGTARGSARALDSLIDATGLEPTAGLYLRPSAVDPEGDRPFPSRSLGRL
jgi:plasmid stabilization system protein ParE